MIGQKKYKYDYNQGNKFIKEAKESFKNGDLSKAEEFISKAKLSNYGFCGNAWASAYNDIYLLEVLVLNKQNKFDESLKVLDSLQGCSIGADCNVRDSLKIVTLFLKFGEEKVKNAFKKVNKLNKSSGSEFELGNYWVFLEELNYKFGFDTGQFGEMFDKNGRKIEPGKTENEFYNLARHRPFYKLIQ